MRIWLSLIIVLLASPAWPAADFSDFTPVDPHKIPSLTNLQVTATGKGTFTEARTIPALEKPILSNGYFIYRQPQGLLWISEQPRPSSTLVTETGVYELQHDGSYRIIPAGEQIGALLKATIFNNWTPLSRYFEMFFKGDRQSWCVGLKAKSSQVQSVLEAVKICGDRHPKEVTLFQARGASTIIDLTFISDQLSEQDALKLDAATQ
ncbi:hypothetical protein [Gynuella sunshinyii]|uniref:Outer membrane lipoprotein carrier protein LolA n=1 Tax=Gynuella sunshinyii YC6258 TaxID=1445510 RepID=A0A0C5VHX3_9GAMM|nr:hypothetical protein [Gynuella sunshinyii]AJQ92968.1 hypothetical Protein YC6258_00918 [Gynuella sunshinyii YC6258]